MNGNFSQEALEAYSSLASYHFSEVSDEQYDFTRCVRPDGTFYGTRGKCRKGSETGPAEKEGTGARGAREAAAAAKAGGAKGGSLLKARAEGKKAAKRADERVAAGEGAASLGKRKSDVIGEATPAQRAAMENKAAQMRNKNAQADRAALTRKVAKEMGEDVRSPKVAKEVEKRQQNMAKKRELSQKEVEAKGSWKKASDDAKAAKAEMTRMMKEMGKDKSPEAMKKKDEAYRNLERAERTATKAQDKYFSVAKRLSALTMTPEQRKEEREWERTKRTLG